MNTPANNIFKTATVIRVNNPFDVSDQERELLPLSHSVKLGDLISADEHHSVSVNGALFEDSDWREYEVIDGDYIVLCPVPGGGGSSGAKNVLRVVALVAIAIAAPYAAAAIPGLTTAAGGLTALGYGVSAGITIAGSMVVNSLLPIEAAIPETSSRTLEESSNSYGIDGPKNSATEGIPVPVVYGTFRVGGNIIKVHTENVNPDDESTQDLYMLFALSEGRIASIRAHSLLINDQPYRNFQKISILTRDGSENQSAIPWFDDVISPYSVGVTLSTSWHTYTTQTTVDKLRVDLVAPSGFRSINDKGESEPIKRTLTVQYKRADEPSTAWRSASNTTVLVPTGSRQVAIIGNTQYELSNLPTNYYFSEGTIKRTVFHTGKIIKRQDKGSTTYTYANYPPDYRPASMNTSQKGGGTAITNGWYIYSENRATGTVLWTRSVEAGDVRTVETFDEETALFGTHSSAYRVSWAWNVEQPGVYQVRIKRDSAESDDARIIDKIIWTDTNEILVSEIPYKHTALLGLKIRLTDQLNARPKVTVEVHGREVRVPVDWYSVGQGWQEIHSRNPAWIALDAITNTRYGLGYGDDRINMSDWMEWASYCEDIGLEFNGIFDTDANFWDSLSHVFRAGRAKIVPQGVKFGVALESPAYPAMMFNVSNMKKSTLNINWLSMSNRANEIQVTYYDKEDAYKAKILKVVSPELQKDANPRVVKLNLIGVTGAEQARMEAQLLLNMNRFIQQTITFEAPIEAIACRVGSLVLVQHDIPQWGYGGRTVTGSTADTIKLDKPVTLEADQSYTIMLNYDFLLVSSGLLGAKINDYNFYIDETYLREGAHALIVNGEEYAVRAVYDQGDGVRKILNLEDFCPAIEGDSYELYRLDALEERNITNVAGETDTITVTPAMPSAPGAYVKWLVGVLEGSQKQFRVVSIEGEGVHTRKLTCVEYDARVYDNEGVLVETPFSLLPGVEHVDDLLAAQINKVVGGISRPVIRVEWTASTNYGGAYVYMRSANEPWQQVAKVASGIRHYEHTELILNETLTFRVVAVDTLGAMTDKNTAPQASVLIEAAGVILGPPTITATKYTAEGIRLEWTNPDSEFYLRTEVLRNTTSDPLGATVVFSGDDEQFIDQEITYNTNYFYWLRTINTDKVPGVLSTVTSPQGLGVLTNLKAKSPFIGNGAEIVWDALTGAATYSVEVYTKGVLRRTEIVSQNEYRYSIEDALEDGDVDRDITFVVWALSATGAPSPTSTINLVNPPPALPANLSVSAGFKSAIIEFTPPDDPDYVDTLVWIAATTGFVPGDANRLATLKGGPITINNLSDNSNYYVRMASRDSWGMGALSAEYNIQTFDLSAYQGLSPWAYVTNTDRAFINANLENDSIDSTKVVSLTASRITTGTLAATEKVSVEGQIESKAGPMEVVMGPRLIDSKVALFSIMNGTVPLIRFNEDGTNEFRGSIVITGGSGYANIADKPANLSDINTTDASKLNDSAVQSASGTLSTTGWYRIAFNTGNRAAARFTLRNTESSRHDSCVFTLGCSYNNPGKASFTLLSSTSYSTQTIQKIRLLTNSTYDDMFVEVYVVSPAGATNGFKLIIEDNYQTSGWDIRSFTVGSIPTGYNSKEWNIGPQYVADNTSTNTSLDTANVNGVPSTTITADLQSALDAAGSAQDTADGKISTFYQTTAPAVVDSKLGDLWFNLADNKKLSRFNGSNWVETDDTRIGQAVDAAQTAQSTADGKAETFFSTTAPATTATSVGDLWYNSNTQVLRRYNGSIWEEVSSFTDQNSVTNGSSLIINGDMTMVAADGRPAGLKACYSSIDVGIISYQNAAKTIAKIQSNDSTVAVAFPAIRVASGGRYGFFMRIKASAATSTGFYFRIQEYDAELPSGITHVSHGGGEAGVVTATRQRTGYRENAPIGTTWEEYYFEYEPTATAKWASPIMLNWTGMGTNELHVDAMQVYPLATYTVNTNQLTDGAGLGTTASWGGVSGTGKPANNADVTGDNTANDTANVNGISAVTITQNLQTALDNAATAQDTADGKITTFYQTGAPTAAVSKLGDLWFDTDDSKKLYRYNGSSWVATDDARIASAIDSAQTAQDTADGKAETFFSTTTPTDMSPGDLWYNTSTKLLKRYSGSSWVNVGNAYDNTSELTDGAGLGQSAVWTSVTGAGKPANNADVTNYADTRVANAITAANVLTIAAPGGARYSGGSGATGAIKITLPVSWTNTMMYFSVDVYNYSTDKSFTLQVGGYNYTSNWVNVSARLIGSVASDNTVRFAHDGTKCCILIGETNSVWSYPKVSVRNFQAGHSNFSIGTWDDGWSIGLVTTLPANIDATISDALLDAQSIKGQGALATKSSADWSNDVSGTGKPADNADVTDYADARILNNLLDLSQWVPGTFGTQGDFVAQTDPSSSTIVTRVGPTGDSEIMWRAGAYNGLDIGYHVSIPNINPKKTYRFTTWLQPYSFPGIRMGFLGTGRIDLEGISNTRPSFVNASPNVSNVWLLLVAEIHGSEYAGSSTGLTGIYDLSGTKIIDGAEFGFAPGTTSVDIELINDSLNGSVYFARSRFVEVNENTLSVPNLLSRVAGQGALATKDDVNYSEIGGSKPPSDATNGADWNSTLSSIPGRLSGETAGVPSLHLTQTHLGFWDGSSWGSFIDNSGSFHFGGLGDNFLDWNGSKLVINTDNFTVDSLGNASFSGSLNAATGTFSGTLQAASGLINGSLRSGNLNAAGEFTGFYAEDGKIGHIREGDFVTAGAGNQDNWVINLDGTFSFSTDGTAVPSSAALKWTVGGTGANTQEPNLKLVNSSLVLTSPTSDIKFSHFNSEWTFDQSITSTGNVTAYSDARLKENIEPIPDALNKVCHLSGYLYDRIDMPEKGRQTGVLAQEILAILPEAVSGGPTEKNPNAMYSVAQGNLVGLLIESIKELSAKVDHLEKELEKK